MCDEDKQRGARLNCYCSGICLCEEGEVGVCVCGSVGATCAVSVRGKAAAAAVRRWWLSLEQCRNRCAPVTSEDAKRVVHRTGGRMLAAGAEWVTLV